MAPAAPLMMIFMPGPPDVSFLPGAPPGGSPPWGVRGRRTPPFPKPMAARAAFTGIGLTSENRTFTRGRSTACRAAAPCHIPGEEPVAKGLGLLGDYVDSTEMQPEPPMERTGTIWSSLPE